LRFTRLYFKIRMLQRLLLLQLATIQKLVKLPMVTISQENMRYKNKYVMERRY